jgi:hypothetical protein
VKDQLEALILQMYRSNILYSEAVREFKKKFIQTVLEANHGNQCRAARQLEMHRNTLSRTLAELKIDVRQLRRDEARDPSATTKKRCASGVCESNRPDPGRRCRLRYEGGSLGKPLAAAGGLATFDGSPLPGSRGRPPAGPSSPPRAAPQSSRLAFRLGDQTWLTRF